jgi:ferredoxin
MNASFGMFMFAGVLLASGIFIARPYCRFLCPYGVLLNWMSRFSWKHMTITPAACIQCRLCENSCPYDAIDYPQIRKAPEGRGKQVKRMMLMTILLPLLIFLGGFTGGLIHETLAGVNPKVKLSGMLQRNEKASDGTELPEITAFRSSGIPAEQLHAEVDAVLSDFLTGSRIFGGFMGLVFGLTLIGLVRTPFRTDYVPNRGTCFSCSKCMDFCPVASE